MRAALAEMRALARRHLAAAQAKLKSAPPEILPALLPVALVGPQLRRMERAGYEPFQLEPVVALAPAMAAVARGARSDAGFSGA